MIASLRGQVKAVLRDAVILDVGGVGYQVFMPTRTLQELDGVGQALEVYTHLQVRETGIALYGFLTAEEMEMFVLLIGVNGVGPRTALATLSTFAPEELREVLAEGDTGALTRIPGIGARTAQRMVIELKDKMPAPSRPRAASAGGADESDVLSALTALGYSLAEAQRALQEIPPDVRGTDQRILAALRILGR